MSEVKTYTRFDDPSCGLQVIELVGEDSEAKSFLCKSDDSFVILKVRKDFQGKSNDEKEKIKKRNIKEGENMKKLSLNTTPAVLGIGGKTEEYDLLANEPPFLILDYVPGITLHYFLEVMRGAGEKPNEFSDLIKYKIIFGIAQGLNLIHQRGLVHRDIKPGNIFIDQDFNPHIGNFVDSTYKQCSKRIHGTRNFIPPEAYQPDGATIPCGAPYDVYEFGGLLFQIITYEWPFNDKDDGNILEELTAKGIRDSRIESGEITISQKDAPLYEIVKLCWNQDPNERPTMDNISHWISDAAPEILGDDFDKFKEYACSIGGDISITGTQENVRKAIANGFAEFDKALRKVAEQEKIPIGKIIGNLTQQPQTNKDNASQ